MTQINARTTKILFAAAVLSISALLAAVVTLNTDNAKLKSDLAKKSESLRQATFTGSELQNALTRARNEFVDLQKKLDEVSQQRQQLEVQVKGLLADRSLARKLEGDVETFKADKETILKQKEAVEKEKQELHNQIAALKEKIKGLETVQVQLYREKEQISKDLQDLRDKTSIKKLEDEAKALKKENSALSSDLKRSHDELSKLKSELEKVKAQVESQEQKIQSAQQKFEDAAQKNKELERTFVDAPLKCAEIARQNKVLIRRTANMHYNMGVFYTKQKEYSRAIAEFEKAVELAPDDAYSYFNLGYIYAEYIQQRKKAIDYFRKYLQYADKKDKDVDWAKKYILTWQAWDGKEPME